MKKIIASLGAIVFASIASAGWTVDVIHDDSVAPSGSSRVHALSSGYVVGGLVLNYGDYSGYPGSINQRATAWPGNGSSTVSSDWTVTNTAYGRLTSVSGSGVGGWQSHLLANSNLSTQHAFWFPDGVSTAVHLHPTKHYESRVYGVYSNRQVGRVRLNSINGPVVAALWTGTARSFKSLHPRQFYWSEALAVHADRIGGAVFDSAFAAYPAGWEGSTNRFRQLDSVPGLVYAVSGGFYAGCNDNGVSSRTAMLWSTSTTNKFLIHDPSWTDSCAIAISEDSVLVEIRRTPGKTAAIYNTFTAGTLDLDAVVENVKPGEFVPGSLVATSIERNASTNVTRVGGSLRRVIDNRDLAVVLTFTP